MIYNKLLVSLTDLNCVSVSSWLLVHPASDQVIQV